MTPSTLPPLPPILNNEGFRQRRREDIRMKEAKMSRTLKEPNLKLNISLLAM